MLLALATPKLCDRFNLARVSPLLLWREGRPAVGGHGGHSYPTWSTPWEDTGLVHSTCSTATSTAQPHIPAIQIFG
jgi:hypothetical protein